MPSFILFERNTNRTEIKKNKNKIENKNIIKIKIKILKMWNIKKDWTNKIIKNNSNQLKIENSIQ